MNKVVVFVIKQIHLQCWMHSFPRPVSFRVTAVSVLLSELSLENAPRPSPNTSVHKIQPCRAPGWASSSRPVQLSFLWPLTVFIVLVCSNLLTIADMPHISILPYTPHCFRVATASSLLLWTRSAALTKCQVMFQTEQFDVTTVSPLEWDSQKELSL